MQIILIHGFGCSSADWSGQVEALGALAEVIAVDLSESSSARRSAGSLIAAMAETVNDVRRACACPDAVLVGHSLGCRVALEAARRLPMALKGLVLIEGSLRVLGDATEAVKRVQSRSAAENKALLMHDFAGMFSDATPKTFRDIVLQRAQSLDDAYATELLSDMTQWDGDEAISALRTAEAPILVLQATSKAPGGERRSIAPQEMSPWLRTVAEQTSGRAEFVRLQGLGHFPHVEAPAKINHLIVSFVERIQTKAPVEGSPPDVRRA